MRTKMWQQSQETARCDLPARSSFSVARAKSWKLPPPTHMACPIGSAAVGRVLAAAAQRLESCVRKSYTNQRCDEDVEAHKCRTCRSGPSRRPHGNAQLHVDQRRPPAQEVIQALRLGEIVVRQALRQQPLSDQVDGDAPGPGAARVKAEDSGALHQGHSAGGLATASLHAQARLCRGPLRERGDDSKHRAAERQAEEQLCRPRAAALVGRQVQVLHRGAAQQRGDVEATGQARQLARADGPIVSGFMRAHLCADRLCLGADRHARTRAARRAHRLVLPLTSPSSRAGMVAARPGPCSASVATDFRPSICIAYGQMSPCFVFIDAPRAKSHSPGESLFLKERGKRDLRRRQSVACAAAAAMLPGVLQQLEGALEWARHTLDAGGRSERLARTEERNRLVQCAYLGHDGVAVRYMILGPADGIPIVMTPGGQMSGIDSIVGPRDERAMSAPLPDVVDAE